jgi:aryl-alcohol dehydrogenase-like predicted oxidoreductase
MMISERVSEFRIGGELPIRRFGFGAMRLTGRGVWGPPADFPAAQAVLRRVVDLGINLIDTADVYGPGDNERLIRDTLAPYPERLVIATKGGGVRGGPATPQNPGMGVDNSEAHLRHAIEGSLHDLGIECIDLYQLHRADPAVPIEETVGVLAKLREEGKIRHIGLSEVGVDQIERARSEAEIATVQNLYNLAQRKHDDVVDYCARHGIGFIAFYPLKIGDLAETEALKSLAAREKVTPALIALAWLFQRSPVIIPIPGTSSLEHLEENVGACRVKLLAQDMEALDGLHASI